MSIIKSVLPTATVVSSIACSTSTYNNRTRYNSTTRVLQNSAALRIGCARRTSVITRSSQSDAIEICVKASVTVPDKLGDCPFSQRVLLTLEEKRLDYCIKLVDLGNKPDWFLEISPEGKVPLIKLENRWILDSDVITESLEQKYPNPSLQTPSEKAAKGAKIFSAFIGFLKSNYDGDGTEEALVNELTSFDEYIKGNGPFINGERICSADLSLGPKLYHMEICLEHYKKWRVPETLPNLKAYMKEIFALPSFVKTQALREDVVAGWQPKVMG